MLSSRSEFVYNSNILAVCVDSPFEIGWLMHWLYIDYLCTVYTIRDLLVNAIVIFTVLHSLSLGIGLL